MQHFQRQLDHGTNNDHLEKPKFEIKINFKVRGFKIKLGNSHFKV